MNDNYLKQLRIIILNKFFVFCFLMLIPMVAYSQNLSFSDNAELEKKILSQFGNLSDVEKQNLLEQYGIDAQDILESETKKLPEFMLGKQGEKLQQLGTDRNLTKTENSEKISSGKKLNQKLEIFGLDLFSVNVGNFSPTDDIMISENYILGPGDELIVQFFGTENRTISIYKAIFFDKRSNFRQKSN